MRVRAGAAALLIAGLALSLTGCNFFVPQWTTTAYDPSDGVSARVGDIELLNAFVITEDGEDGNLVATAVNRGDDDVELVLQFTSNGERTDITVEIPARSSVDLGFGAEGQLFLAGIDTPPGALLAIYLQYGEQQGRQVLLPVLDGSLSEYAQLLPTPTPTPVESPAPEPEPPAGDETGDDETATE